MTKHGSGAMLEQLTGCGWLKKLQVVLLNQVRACGNKQGVCTSVCVGTQAHVHRNSNHICFWNWKTKSVTLLLGLLWKEVTECGTLFPSLSSVQLAKREEKIHLISSTLCWFQICSFPSFNSRNTFLLGIIILLYKCSRRSFTKPHPTC